MINRSARNSWLIISARFISDFGAFLNMVALSTYVYLLSQSVTQVSIFLACRVTGGILASLFGVPYFRRFTGRLPLVILDILRAALLALLLIFPSSVQLYLLPFIALGIGIGNSMFAFRCWNADSRPLLYLASPLVGHYYFSWHPITDVDLRMAIQPTWTRLTLDRNCQRH